MLWARASESGICRLHPVPESPLPEPGWPAWAARRPAPGALTLLPWRRGIGRVEDHKIAWLQSGDNFQAGSEIAAYRHCLCAARPCARNPPTPVLVCPAGGKSKCSMGPPAAVPRAGNVKSNFRITDPGSNSPLGLGTWTSVSRVRDAGSIAPAMCASFPVNTRLGNSAMCNWAEQVRYRMSAL